jgi:hypothetical protein
MSEIAAEVVGTNQAPAGSEQPSPVDKFSFAGLHEQAMAFGSENNDTPEPVAEAPVQEQVFNPLTKPAQPQAVAAEPKNVDNATAGQLAALKDTDLVEVTVDGQPVQMPWADARGGVMRQAKFTKEMQGLAAQRQQFEQERGQVTQLQQEREALVTIVSNPQLLKEFISKQYPGLFQAAQGQPSQEALEQAGVDPGDIATVGQLAEIQRQATEQIRTIAQELQDGLTKREQAIADSIETRHATLKLSNDINSTIKTIFSENAFLSKVIPNAEQLLRYEVSKLQPRTPEETLAAFKQVAAGWVEQFNETVKETTKATVVQKQQLVKNNIQPPGGAGVQPQPTGFMKQHAQTGKVEVDWKKLNEMASSMLQG